MDLTFRLHTRLLSNTHRLLGFTTTVVQRLSPTTFTSNLHMDDRAPRHHTRPPQRRHTRRRARSGRTNTMDSRTPLHTVSMKLREAIKFNRNSRTSSLTIITSQHASIRRQNNHVFYGTTNQTHTMFATRNRMSIIPTQMVLTRHRTTKVRGRSTFNINSMSAITSLVFQRTPSIHLQLTLTVNLRRLQPTILVRHTNLRVITRSFHRRINNVRRHFFNKLTRTKTSFLRRNIRRGMTNRTSRRRVSRRGPSSRQRRLYPKL